MKYYLKVLLLKKKKICAKNTRLIKAHISYTLCVCLCVSLNVHHLYLSEIRSVRVLLILCHGYSQLQD